MASRYLRFPGHEHIVTFDTDAVPDNHAHGALHKPWIAFDHQTIIFFGDNEPSGVVVNAIRSANLDEVTVAASSCRRKTSRMPSSPFWLNPENSQVAGRVRSMLLACIIAAPLVRAIIIRDDHVRLVNS